MTPKKYAFLKYGAVVKPEGGGNTHDLWGDTLIVRGVPYRKGNTWRVLVNLNSDPKSPFQIVGCERLYPALARKANMRRNNAMSVAFALTYGLPGDPKTVRELLKRNRAKKRKACHCCKEPLCNITSGQNAIPKQPKLSLDVPTVGLIVQTARPTWTQYFMTIAETIATRSTCTRKKVGCLVVSVDKHILVSGYNGSITGFPHCDAVGCTVEDGHCVATVHAELNAVAQAARYGVSLKGATLYCTASPCWNCFKTLANAGIIEVVFKEFYRDERTLKAASQAKIILRDMEKTYVVAQ